MNVGGGWALRLRVPLLVLIGAASLVAWWAAARLEHETSVESMVLSDDPDLISTRRMNEVFGADEFIVVAVNLGADLFTPQGLAYVDALRDRLADLPETLRASAVTDVKVARSVGRTLVVGPLAATLPETLAEARAFKAQVYRYPPLVGTLISQDGRTAAVRVDVPPPTEADREVYIRAVRGIRDLVSTPPFDRYPTYVAGAPVLRVDLAASQRADRTRFTVMAVAVMLIILILGLRSLWLTVLPLAAVQIGAVWLHGAMHLLGDRMTVVSTALAPLILVIGVAVAVHVIIGYHEHFRRLVGSSEPDGPAGQRLSGGQARAGRQDRLAVRQVKYQALTATVRQLARPCMLTSVTTMAGFLSLALSPIAPVQKFGIYAAAGVGCVFVTGLLVVPLVLSFLPPPSRRLWARIESGWLRRTLRAAGLISERRPRTIVMISTLLLGGAALGIPRLKVETQLIDYFRDGASIKTASLYVNTHLSGASPFDVTLRVSPDVLEARGGVADPELLQRIDRMQRWLASLPEVNNPIAITDALKALSRALDDDDDRYRLPATRAEAAQLLMLYRALGDPEQIDDLVADLDDEARINARLSVRGSARFVAIIDEARAQAQRIFADYPVEVHVTGVSVLYANMVEMLVDGQILSLLLACGLVSLAMIFVAGRLKLGLIAMLPNVIPVVVNLGVMGWAGISLNIATTMIGSVAIGIAVDDTIHFVTRYRRELEIRGDHREAIRVVLETTGHAILLTSLVLTSGFWVLLASSFKPTMYFGLLAGCTVVSALLADLFLTPALIHLVEARRGATPSRA